eukprot:Skav232513  [mRNA]  locus=scaffold1096:695968:701101:+ [translate_table: standard]
MPLTPGASQASAKRPAPDALTTVPSCETSVAMEFGVRLHTEGRYQGLPDYEPNLHKLQCGSRVTLVAMVGHRDPEHGHLCQGMLTGQKFRVKGYIPDSCSKITILNGLVSHFRTPIIEVDKYADMLHHHARPITSLFGLVETCSGIGALGCGASYAGWTVEAYNDVAEPFCQHLRKTTGKPVIHGGICKLETVAALHRAAPGAGSIAMGFSCQPFSSLGDQRQGNDPRANTLPYGLYAAYLMQKDLIILECVPNASQSPWVQRCLQQHLQATKGDRSEILLELNDMWPSKRRRWWTIITPCFLGKTLLMPLPKLQGLPSVACVIPHPIDLTDAELGQLILTSDERRQFEAYSKGVQQMLVDFADALPTALHSWGNQCTPCKCGCRGPLSEGRLQEHGLYGALMNAPFDVYQQDLRHISPKELCILVGFPKTSGFEDCSRLLLAGVGQLASPIQSSWIFAHLRNQLVDSQLTHVEACSPNAVLANVIGDLLGLRDQWFNNYITVPMEVFRANLEQLLNVPIGSTERLPKCLSDQHMPTEPDTSMEAESPHAHQDPAPMATEVLDMPAPEQSHMVPEMPTGAPAATESGSPAFTPALRSMLQEEPVDQVTGAVTAFSSEARGMNEPSISDPVLPPTNAFDSESRNPHEHAVNSEEVIAPTVPMEDDAPPESDNAVAHDILQGKMVVVDLDELQVTMLHYQPGMKVQHYLAAEEGLAHMQVTLHNCLGHVLGEDEQLSQHQLLMKSVGTFVQPTGLTQLAADNMHRDRQSALLSQGGAVAVDELMFYLSGMQSHAVKVVAPMVIHDLGDVPSALYQWWDALSSEPVEYAASALLVNEHWLPVVLQLTDEPTVFLTEEGKQYWQLMSPHLHGTSPAVRVGATIQSQFPSDCGFQAVQWIMQKVHHEEYHPMQVTRACQWRFLFWQHLLTQPVMFTGYIPLGGHPSEIETAIAALLREHGVFPDRVMDRAQQVIQSIGASSIHQLLNGPRPWQALKDRANRQHPRLRLIHEDEFAQVVKGRAKDKPIATQKQSHKSNKMAVPPVMITPADIAIPEGVFRQSDGTIVGQLQVRQINPTSRGVVVLTEQEFQPYQASQPLTKEGLGMLIPVPCTPDLQKLGQLVGFPVQSVASGEPMLISAVLIQRGQMEVSRCTPQQQVQVEQIQTKTVKVMVYRDQCPTDWEQVADKPVRCILDLWPGLKICKTQGCKCDAWHQGDTEHEPLLDVWQRDFLNLHFKKSRPSEAALLVCMMRVTTEAFTFLQRSSGQAGIYIEARSHDAKQQDPSLHTVWLSKMSYDEARAAQTKIEVPTCLLRVTYRYGLHVASTQAKVVHEKFKPMEPFLASSVKSTWIVGPMPWGTTRRALIKLFTTWNWSAKPLQTAGVAADRTGLKWHVVADGPPPNYVYNLSHGDVLIVQAHAPMQQASSSTRVEASVHTQKLMQPTKTLHEDPWAGAAAKLPHVQAAQQINMASIEASVEARVLARLQKNEDAQMDCDADARISALETQMTQMQQEQQQHQVQTQTLQQKVENLGRQISHNGSQLKDHIDTQMRSQMERIEELLSKRAKHE